MSDVGNNRNRIIDALRKQSGTNLTRDQFLENFVLADPARPTSVSPRKNTSVKVTAKLESKYFGTKTAWYNRIHVSELGVIEVTRTTETKVVQLLPQINTKYNLNLTAFDIINFDLLTSQVGTFPIILPIDPTSLMFYDGEFIPTIDNLTPPPPVAWDTGMLLSSYCVGFDRMGVFSDGSGGQTTSLLQVECLECGYDPANNIYLIIDGGNANIAYTEPWQWAGEQGAG